MKLFDNVKNLKFEKPSQILDFFKNHKITCKVDPDTKDRIYALNPETKRTYTYMVKQTTNGAYLYLMKA